jgi:hypothetical protein
MRKDQYQWRNESDWCLHRQRNQAGCGAFNRQGEQPRQFVWGHQVGIWQAVCRG